MFGLSFKQGSPGKMFVDMKPNVTLPKVPNQNIIPVGGTDGSFAQRALSRSQRNTIIDS